MGTTACHVEAKYFDFSKIDYRGTLKELPTWEIAVKISVVVLLELFALLGNILVIVLVMYCKKLRTTTNYYIVNLAVSDLLVACFPIWMHLVDSLTDGWVLGAFLCKVNPFIQIIILLSNVFTLIVIAGDRFFAIMFPLKSRVTQRKVSVVLILVWLCATAIGLPVLFFFTYDERVWKDYHEKYCTEVWPMVRASETTCDMGVMSKRAYWTFVCVVLNWIPMIVMTMTYTIILIKLRGHKVVPSNSTMSKSAIQQRSKRKVIKMLFSVLVIFIVCALPFQITKLYNLYRHDQTEKLPKWFEPLDFAAVLLLYANSAINPIIYGGLNENFRSGLKDMFNSVVLRKPRSNSEYGSDQHSRSLYGRGPLSTIRRNNIKLYETGKDDTDENKPEQNTAISS
ncbi:hypothetical protein ACJMK2_033940 [Sinanodonta woodiana]|uniref:G-protein coupled receptors family 1 profile domain-containing protein n=1 Tax=Sinanodonta woodiana TaxID=1069815 RepID=A0ABD3WU86_SINWO